jgi:hypothetical protein
MIVTVIARLRQILLCLGDWMSTSIMWSSAGILQPQFFFDTGQYDEILLAVWRDHRGVYDHTWPRAAMRAETGLRRCQPFVATVKLTPGDCWVT